MNQPRPPSRHAQHGLPGPSPWALPSLLLAAALLTIAGWSVFHQLTKHDAPANPGAASTPSAVPTGATTSPAAPVEHHGNAPDCPDTDCVAMLVNGDMLFHASLWQQFAKNPTATDGTAFDFTPLFASMTPYIQASDLAVCQFETPIAQRGGPYAAYPVFNIPPETVDAAAHAGYQACTHATNHSWDQGAEGIARLNDAFDADGLAHTGSYVSEQDSITPLVVDSVTGGGSVGLLAGTVSLNGQVADHDWRVDRLRESGDPQHQSDIDKAVAKAAAARKAGADIVTMSMHSVQEYLDTADSWQISEAHELADTGAFNLIYGTGCHCAQPIEYYHGTWIIYGLGNVVTETSYLPGHGVNNEGVTTRIQFAGTKGKPGSWKVSRIDWLPTASVRQGQYRWCSLAADHPDGDCWDAAKDAQVRQRIHDVIYAMGADPHVVREWLISEENQ